MKKTAKKQKISAQNQTQRGIVVHVPFLTNHIIGHGGARNYNNINDLIVKRMRRNKSPIN